MHKQRLKLSYNIIESTKPVLTELQRKQAEKTLEELSKLLCLIPDNQYCLTGT